MVIEVTENVCHQGADAAKTARANHRAVISPKTRSAKSVRLS